MGRRQGQLAEVRGGGVHHGRPDGGHGGDREQPPSPQGVRPADDPDLRVHRGLHRLEAGVGIRLPVSALYNAINSSQTFAVTSVFHNQNDLATYLALCWPFMLAAFFFTRRRMWLILDVLFIILGAAAFVRSGSRSSLVAAGISTLAALVLFARLGRRLGPRLTRVPARSSGPAWPSCSWRAPATCCSTTRRAPCCGSSVWRRCSARRRRAQARGPFARALTRAAWRSPAVALRGRRPGQAEAIISSGTNALGISNLHDWWLETYADGGVVGFVLHLAFYLLLVIGLWPLARDPDPLVRYLASGTVLALLGFTVGALGPSSSVSFAPMWIIYGLGLALISRSAWRPPSGRGRSRREVQPQATPPTGVSAREGARRLTPVPVARHRAAPVRARADPRVARAGRAGPGAQPHPYVPRLLWRDPRQRRRGQKPLTAVRDGVAAEYPRVLQPPRRLFFEHVGDMAYYRLRHLPSLRNAQYDLIHAHQALPDGALAQRLARDLRVPYVVTVHGADVYQHLRSAGRCAPHPGRAGRRRRRDGQLECRCPAAGRCGSSGAPHGGAQRHHRPG